MSKKGSNPGPPNIKNKPPPPPSPPPKRIIAEDVWKKKGENKMGQKQPNPRPPNVPNKPTPPPPLPPPPQRMIKDGCWVTPPRPPPPRSVTGYRSLRCVFGFHKLRNTEPQKGLWGRYKCTRDRCNYATLGVSEMYPGMPAPPKPVCRCNDTVITCKECGLPRKSVITECPKPTCLVRLNGRCSLWHDNKCNFVG